MTVKKHGEFYDVETHGYKFVVISDHRGTRLAGIPHLQSCSIDVLETYIKALEDVKQAMYKISVGLMTNL